MTPAERFALYTFPNSTTPGPYVSDTLVRSSKLKILERQDVYWENFIEQG